MKITKHCELKKDLEKLRIDICDEIGYDINSIITYSSGSTENLVVSKKERTMTKIKWDCEDIYELERILKSLSDDELENIQWDALPSVDFPGDVDTTDVWAMDKHGRVLWGSISDAIEIGFDKTNSVITLDELREKQDRLLSFEFTVRKTDSFDRQV